MKSNLTKFALSAGIMLAMALTLSCSSGDDGNSNNGGTSSGSDGGSSSPSGGGSIINADNEAWLSSWEIKGNDAHQGFIYKQNGEGFELQSYDGIIWCRKYILTYSISGNQITWCRIREKYPDGQCNTSSYSISGNTVTLGSSYTFIRTSGVNISGDCN